jgi:pimeloyl-ACP methyl ester carboxylesterase
MAHGIAAQRDFGLQPFAERFVEKGLAVFLFDYRNFGDSDGAPRNLVSPTRHVQDWQAAIAHVRGLSGINKGKIALWGSSFSGGHVLVAAAKTPGISAVVSQVPFVDGISTTMLFDMKYQLTGMFHGIWDLLKMLSFQRPHYVPVVADPGVFALMNTPESKPGYLALIPEGSTWKNEAPARILLTLPMYRPISYASKINCPVLIVYAEKDSLISPKAVEKTASKIKDVRKVPLPVGHFDLYAGAMFEKAVETEADFLCEQLIKK